MMGIRPYHIPVVKTARYCTLGGEDPPVGELWYVCHGYGQLAYYFLKWFEPLESRKRLIVAPEGMNRFYLKGTSGRVGASWMTKEDRSTDIQDYVTYLDGLDQKLSENFESTPQKVVFGFSQGTATVGRWVGLGEVDPDVLVLWAGVMPHDLDLQVNRDKMRNMKVFMLYGDDDPYREEAMIQEHRQLFEENGISCRFIEFEGGHKVEAAPLQELASEIREGS